MPKHYDFTVIADPAHIAAMSDDQTEKGFPILHPEALQDMIDVMSDMEPRHVTGRHVPSMSGRESLAKIAIEEADMPHLFEIAKFWDGGTRSVEQWTTQGGMWRAPEIPSAFTALAVGLNT